MDGENPPCRSDDSATVESGTLVSPGEEELLSLFQNDGFDASAQSVEGVDVPQVFRTIQDPALRDDGQALLLPPPPELASEGCGEHTGELLGLEMPVRTAASRRDAGANDEAGVRGRCSLLPSLPGSADQDPEAQKHLETLARMLGSARQRSTQPSEGLPPSTRHGHGSKGGHMMRMAAFECGLQGEETAPLVADGPADANLKKLESITKALRRGPRSPPGGCTNMLCVYCCSRSRCTVA